jgi:hypothetical protein
MLFSSWLRSWKASLERRRVQRRTRRARPTSGRLAPRLFLEALEDRCVPASLDYFSTALFQNANSYSASIYATAVDSAGNIYVTGQVGSGSLATTPGALETSGNGSFVAKLSPTGAVLYADFVAELNPTGSGLLYGTYLPGTTGVSWGSYVSAIAVDDTGNIYVAGSAGAGLPTTADAFQTAYLAGNDAFFAKIDPTLSGTASLLYASYLGGGGSAATGIAVDSAGNAYLEGDTGSASFPTTSGAFQTTCSTATHNVFVAKLDPALSGAASLVYSTYLGGSKHLSGDIWGSGYVPNANVLEASETVGGIAVDSAGNAYVTAATTFTDFPTTAGAFQTTSNLQPSNSTMWSSDVFVTKLNPTGSALVYSTYLGGGTNGGHGTSSGGAGIAVDASGDAYVTGWTNSTSFPTMNPVQATNQDAGAFDGAGDGMNAFVTELNPAGSGLLFSTYLGSGNKDYDG